jgi:fused signal recognition particle receptor
MCSSPTPPAACQQQESSHGRAVSKVVRVLGKLNPAAPHEVMLVLDAGTGQNALAQADQFREAVGVTG